jgi:hypothetical protein
MPKINGSNKNTISQYNTNNENSPNKNVLSDEIKVLYRKYKELSLNKNLGGSSG